MARGRAQRAGGKSSGTPRIAGDKPIAMQMNHGVIGTGIVGGGSTAMNVPAMAKPLPGGAKPGTRLGAKSLRGKR